MNKQVVIENLNVLTKTCPIKRIQIFNDSLILVVKPDLIFNVLLFFKNHILYQFKLLTCISGVDYPSNKYRFQVVYELLSIRYNFRIRIKTFVYELLGIESCESLLPSAASSARFARRVHSARSQRPLIRSRAISGLMSSLRFITSIRS